MVAPIARYLELSAVCPKCGMNPLNVRIAEPSGEMFCTWCNVQVHIGVAEDGGGWDVKPAASKYRKYGRTLPPPKPPRVRTHLKVVFATKPVTGGWDWEVKRGSDRWGGRAVTVDRARVAIQVRLRQIWTAARLG